MNQIDYFKDGLGALIFIISIPAFVFAWVALACVKDIIIEKLKK